MNKDFLINHFQQTYGTYQNIKKNPILKSIVYLFGSIDDIEQTIYNIILEIQTTLNHKYNKNYNIIDMAYPLIYMYNSHRIILDLPHMRDKIKYKNRPSLHVIFGEVMSQLVSVALFSESLQMLNNFNMNELDEQLEDEIKTKNLNFIVNSFDFDESLIDLSTSKLKYKLEKLFQENIQKMYKITIDVSLNYYILNETKEKQNYRLFFFKKFQIY